MYFNASSNTSHKIRQFMIDNDLKSIDSDYTSQLY